MAAQDDVEKPRRVARGSTSCRFPAKIEASSWAEEVSLRRAIADSLSMAWQKPPDSNNPKNRVTNNTKNRVTVNKVVEETIIREPSIVEQSDNSGGLPVCVEAPKGVVLDSFSRRKRRKVANVPQKRYSQAVKVNPNCKRVKEQESLSGAAVIPSHESYAEEKGNRGDFPVQMSHLHESNSVVEPSARVHLDERSVTNSEAISRLHNDSDLGQEASALPSLERHSAVQQEKRPVRMTRARRRPFSVDLPSKEEEAMLQCALSNSLAITRREQSAFDLIIDAPVYAPSNEEFADPVSFIESIRPDAEQYGLCKVVPPEGWDPPFCFDPSTHFPTRRQKVHRLQQGEGFCESREYSWEEYKAMALEAEQKWITRVGKNAQGEELSRLLEREFWRIVETGSEEVEVDYGSDLMVGSGFPRPSKTSADKYARSPWNLLNLPQLKGSLLQFLDGNMPGVTVPWMYIGMIFTAFCFHTEDNFLYSVNYHHLGAPKTWYGVPAAESASFEKAMRQEVPGLFATRPDLLHELVTAVSPTHLLARKVPLYRLRQFPGEFVITYPRAYHAGFNHGFNCAEAVNFAPVNWLPYGAQGMAKYRRFNKMSALNFHELLCRAAQEDLSPRMAPWIEEQLAAVLKQQIDQRESIAMDGTLRSRQCNITERRDGTCSVCQSDLYLAAIMCPCRPKKQACLQCAAQICSCGPTSRVLLYRLSLADLERLLKRMRVAGKGHHIDGKRDPEKGETNRAMFMQARLESYRLERKQRAQSWIHQAEKELKKEGSPTNERRSAVQLLLQAEEFLWGGSNMDGVRRLCEQLQHRVDGTANDIAPAVTTPPNKSRSKLVRKIQRVWKYNARE